MGLIPRTATMPDAVSTGTARIPFNRPFIAGKELFHIAQSITLGNISGDGFFTERCSQLIEQRFAVRKALMTPSCTAALEMAAQLCDLGPGDEVIMPSFTFVSTANAVVRLGAKPVFVDIRPDTLNIDETKIESAITPRTKAIFPVHYAGVACEMDTIMAIAKAHTLWVVEDAAQGVDAYYRGRPLGSIGHLGCYSFHETKNVICGEGGALCVNDPQFISRAEIIRDKGTNRKQFFRGQVDKYTWVDVGSSYVPSEIACAFLYGQFEHLDLITSRRRELFRHYDELLQTAADLHDIRLPSIPAECASNYHLYYVLLENEAARNDLMASLEESNIGTVFHYVPLHSSPFARKLGLNERPLPVTDDVSRRLLRLPMFFDLTLDEQKRVASEIGRFLAPQLARFAA
jgi:dTDP-4-amino-4,6-dideoxygalactose transaminase